MKVIVKTSKSKSKIVSYDSNSDTYTVELTSKPVDFKANKELLSLFSKEFKKRFEIISGKTSKIKILKEI